MRKMLYFSKRTVARIRNSRVKLECKKLLGNDGKATGYMEIIGEPGEFQKLAKKGIYVYALCWNPENPVCDEYISKRTPQSSPPKVRQEKRYMDALSKYLPEMPKVAKLVKGNESLQAVIVKPLAPAAEIALHEKATIYSTSRGGLFLAVFTSEEWRKACLNFKIIAKYSQFKKRWMAKTIRKKERLERKSPFDVMNAAMNSLQENRYTNQPYDGRRPGEKMRYPKVLKDAHQIADAMGNKVTTDPKTGKQYTMGAADRQQLFEKIVAEKTFDKLLDRGLENLRPESERK